MTTSTDQFRLWLEAPEGVHLEFKEARHRYDFEKLLQYCVALANEGGGHVLLGVSDQRPRKVVGTQAFSEPGRTEAGLRQRLGHRVPVEELQYDNRASSDRARTNAPPRNRMALGWALSQARWR